MSSKIRLTVDSLLDKIRLRVLVSVDGKREESFMITRKDLGGLLRRKKMTAAEGQVFTFEADKRKLLTFLKKANVKGISVTKINKTRPKAPKFRRAIYITGVERGRIRQRQDKMRKRMRGVE